MTVAIKDLVVSEVYEVDMLGEVVVKKVDIEGDSIVLDIFDKDIKEKYGQVDGYTPFCASLFECEFIKAV